MGNLTAIEYVYKLLENWAYDHVVKIYTFIDEENSKQWCVEVLSENGEETRFDGEGETLREAVHECRDDIQQTIDTYTEWLEV